MDAKTWNARLKARYKRIIELYENGTLGRSRTNAKAYKHAKLYLAKMDRS